jgi:hypothetical protein
MVDAEPKPDNPLWKRVDTIYPHEKLKYDMVKNNPVLEPLLRANKTYENSDLILQRSLWEFEQLEKEINDALEKNSMYSRMIIMGKIERLREYMKWIIQSLTLERDTCKEAIIEIVEKVDKEYGLLVEELREEPKAPVEEEVGYPKEDTLNIQESEKESEEGKIPLVQQTEFIFENPTPAIEIKKEELDEIEKGGE